MTLAYINNKTMRRVSCNQEADGAGVLNWVERAGDREGGMGETYFEEQLTEFRNICMNQSFGLLGRPCMLVTAISMDSEKFGRYAADVSQSEMVNTILRDIGKALAHMQRACSPSFYIEEIIPQQGISYIQRKFPDLWQYTQKQLVESHRKISLHFKSNYESLHKTMFLKNDDVLKVVTNILTQAAYEEVVMFYNIHANLMYFLRDILKTDVQLSSYEYGKTIRTSLNEPFYKNLYREDNVGDVFLKDILTVYHLTSICNSKTNSGFPVKYQQYFKKTA